MARNPEDEFPCVIITLGVVLRKTKARVKFPPDHAPDVFFCKNPSATPYGKSSRRGNIHVGLETTDIGVRVQVSPSTRSLLFVKQLEFEALLIDSVSKVPKLNKVTNQRPHSPAPGYISFRYILKDVGSEVSDVTRQVL
jgi:hypothetical protein